MLQNKRYRKIFRLQLFCSLGAPSYLLKKKQSQKNICQHHLESPYSFSFFAKPWESGTSATPKMAISEFDFSILHFLGGGPPRPLVGLTWLHFSSTQLCSTQDGPASSYFSLAGSFRFSVFVRRNFDVIDSHFGQWTECRGWCSAGTGGPP